jgi:hypothetical protein
MIFLDKKFIGQTNVLFLFGKAHQSILPSIELKKRLVMQDQKRLLKFLGKLMKY